MHNPKRRAYLLLRSANDLYIRSTVLLARKQDWLRLPRTLLPGDAPGAEGVEAVLYTLYGVRPVAIDLVHEGVDLELRSVPWVPIFDVQVEPSDLLCLQKERSHYFFAMCMVQLYKIIQETDDAERLIFARDAGWLHTILYP